MLSLRVRQLFPNNFLLCLKLNWPALPCADAVKEEKKANRNRGWAGEGGRSNAQNRSLHWAHATCAQLFISVGGGGGCARRQAKGSLRIFFCPPPKKKPHLIGTVSYKLYYLGHYSGSTLLKFLDFCGTVPTIRAFRCRKFFMNNIFFRGVWENSRVKLVHFFGSTHFPLFCCR